MSPAAYTRAEEAWYQADLWGTLHHSDLDTRDDSAPVGQNLPRASGSLRRQPPSDKRLGDPGAFVVRWG